MSAEHTDDVDVTSEVTSDGSLRERAEQYYLQRSPQSVAEEPEGVEVALHELRVHQIELEMQNEELRRAQLEIDSVRAKYFDLYDLAPVGYVTVDRAGIVAEANLTASELLGVDRSALIGAPLSKFVASDDGDDYYLHLKRLTDSAEPRDFQLRFQRGDGAFWASVQVRVSSPESDSDRPEYRLTFSDIGALKRAEEARERVAERLQAVVNGSHDIIYALEPRGTVQFVSPSCRVLLGYKPADIVGRSFASIVHPDDAKRCELALAEVVADSKKDTVVEYRIQRADGSWRWFESNIAPVYSPLGGVVEYVGNARDITDHKFEASQAQMMAMTDELTGIGNRRLLTIVGVKEFKRSRRYDYPLSCLMIDVDNLKRINDTFDHAAGDHAIQLTARVCRDTCRDVDETGRLGGDEFAVLLPHVDGPSAYDIGERIRHEVESEPPPAGLPADFKVSVSVGVGVVEPDDTEFADVLERSDHALQRAKKQRNWTSV